MKCGADNTTCMARSGDQCLEHLFTDTPTCSSRVPQTNGDYIRSMSDEELAAERIEFSYNPNGPDEYIGDFGSVPVKYIAGKKQPESRQEALRRELDWLRQPKETP